AKRYHGSLIIAALLLTLLYIAAHPQAWNLCLFIAFIPLGKHLRTVIRNKNPKILDPELKKVALSTFLYALIFLAISFLEKPNNNSRKISFQYPIAFYICTRSAAMLDVFIKGFDSIIRKQYKNILEEWQSGRLRRS